MPATQHDLVLWFTSSAYDYIFDFTHDAVRQLADVARISDETTSWPYHGKHDLTGFIDGTENPKLTEAPDVVLVPEGQPGAGGSIRCFRSVRMRLRNGKRRRLRNRSW